MSDTPQPRVLCVDDEPLILEGLESNLAWHYEVQTAVSGAEGLDSIRRNGPFALVISDMRMPGMDGATFLREVRKEAPDTTRILLTGYADIEAAMEAVNKGNIFRFLSKPCAPDVLLPAVQAATEQYQLVRAERELLENTLGGAIMVLTDVLSLAAPVAFSRASCIKGYVQHMTSKLNVPDAWQYELAAMLSQIGCITLPPDTLDKAYAGQELTEGEEEMLRSHPAVGRNLLSQVPRLERVAEMISQQRDGHGEGLIMQPSTRDEQVLLGASMLRLALEVDHAVIGGASVKSAVASLCKKKTGHSALLLDALKDYHAGKRVEVVKAVHVRDLQTFMVLDEDVHATNGNVVVTKGREINGALIERLKNFANGVGLVEPIRVRVPSR